MASESILNGNGASREASSFASALIYISFEFNNKYRI
jgi:hypothetical protein